MVSWGWLIAAFFIGDMMGIFMMAILYGSWSHQEKKAEEKKNRQRCNADGSKGGVL